MKVSPAFSKAAGCRGGALARAPQSAESPCAYVSAGGGLRGNPRRGFPLFFWVCTCAPLRWVVVDGLSCDSTPFLWCLPKETVSSRQRKALFYLGGSTIRVSATASVVVTHLRPTWGGAGGLTGRSSQLDAVGGDVGASSPWERRAGPNSCRGGTQKRVSLGLHPVSLRKSKEMGWNGQGQRGLLPNKTAHTYKAKDKAASSLGFYVCAVTLGGGRCPLLPFDPISLVLAQRNGVEPPKKSAFLPRRLHHPRERYK